MTKEPMHWTDKIWWAQICLLAGGMAILCWSCSGAELPEREDDNCDDTFSPSPELESVVQKAAAEWHKAIGREICVKPGGIPVISVATVIVYNDSKCGGTPTVYQDHKYESVSNIQIADLALSASDCTSLHRVVLHEMGHALAKGWELDPIHTDSGLMAKYANAVDGIDGSAIELVCKRSYCW